MNDTKISLHKLAGIFLLIVAPVWSQDSLLSLEKGVNGLADAKIFLSSEKKMFYVFESSADLSFNSWQDTDVMLGGSGETLEINLSELISVADNTKYFFRVDLYPIEGAGVDVLDSDGLADWWEMLYYGDLTTNNDPTAQEDADGLSAAEEAHLGLDPTVSDLSQSETIKSYIYDDSGWLTDVNGGIATTSFTLDAEGNLTNQ